MTILWASLVIVFVFSFMARYFSVPASVGPTYIHPNKIMAGAVALSLVLVSGLRNNIGDTFFYMHGYMVNDLSWEGVMRKKDKGFNLFQMLLKQISDDPQILLITTALITNVLIVIVLYKYARLFEISMFVYIASGAFIVSMNGVRQYLAAAIVFVATKALLDGRWKQYMLIVLLASLFHQSALIMIPIYFVVRRKAWTSATFALLAVAVLIVMGYSYFSELLFAAIQETQYGHYESFQEGGANIIRVLVNLAPLSIAYLGREKLRALFPQSDIIVNLSIVGAVLMIIATQNWIFARLYIYFSLYQLILMGWIVLLFRHKEQRLIYFTIICLYLVYFFYENEIILQIRYGSKYLVWPF